MSKDLKTGFEDFIDPIMPGIPTHQDLNLALMHLTESLATMREDLANISTRAGKRDSIIERIHLAVDQQNSKLDSLLAWKASMRAIAGQ